MTGLIMETSKKIKYTEVAQGEQTDTLNENQIRLIAEKMTQKLKQGDHGKEEEFTEWL